MRALFWNDLLGSCTCHVKANCLTNSLYDWLTNFNRQTHSTTWLLLSCLFFVIVWLMYTRQSKAHLCPCFFFIKRKITVQGFPDNQKIQILGDCVVEAVLLGAAETAETEQQCLVILYIVLPNILFIISVTITFSSLRLISNS